MPSIPQAALLRFPHVKRGTRGVVAPCSRILRVRPCRLARRAGPRRRSGGKILDRIKWPWILLMSRSLSFATMSLALLFCSTFRTGMRVARQDKHAPDCARKARRLFPMKVEVCVATPEMYESPLFAVEASAMSRAVPERRREFVAGRSCARVALARLGAPASPICVGPDRAPVWRLDT